MNLEDLDFEKLHIKLLDIKQPTPLAMVNKLVAQWLIDEEYWDDNHYLADCSPFRKDFFESVIGEDFYKIRNFVRDLMLVPAGLQKIFANGEATARKITVFTVEPDHTPIDELLIKAVTTITDEQAKKLSNVVINLINHTHLPRSKAIEYTVATAKALSE